MKKFVIVVEVESDEDPKVIRDEIEEALTGHFENENIDLTNWIVHPPREVS